MKKSILIFSIAFLSYMAFASAERAGSSFFQKIIPENFQIGDAQFAIQIYNDKNETIYDVAPFLTGNGFSTYEIIPIDSLDSGQRGYVFVKGNFKNDGNITINLKFREEASFISVMVIDLSQKEKQEKIEKENALKASILENLSSELSLLKIKYSELEGNISQKKDNNYDVSKINLNDLKNYIRAAESRIYAKDIDNAQINIRLAIEELNYQKTLLANAKMISLITRLRDNAVIFTAIAGAIITFFALSELLKRKGVDVVKTVGGTGKKTLNKKKN